MEHVNTPAMGYETPAMEWLISFRKYHDLVMVVRSFCMAKNVPERFEPKKVASTVWVNSEEACFGVVVAFGLPAPPNPAAKANIA